MSLQNRILDNRNGATVVEHLRRELDDADALSIVSAYFTIYGYELLANELDRVRKVRFLFGDPSSVDDIDPGENESKSFDLTEKGLTPNHALRQKALAKECAEWIRKDSVQVRSVSPGNFLHGKMYLTESSDEAKTGVVGSSNFTKRGLGGSDQANLEINLATEDPETLVELQGWFGKLWDDDKATKDIKQRVLNALGRLGRDYAPEAVYYKTLYELFRQDIDARRAGDNTIVATGCKDSQIWNTLYEFQKDGALSVIAKLRDHNGCILADNVGLGKTYTALAVIKYFEQHNDRVLVLCPRKLYDNWSLYPAANGHRQNPFPKDRFAYTLLAHTDLSRDFGKSGGVDLSNFTWGNYDLIVIDESHNFRNDGGKRYQRLLDEVVKAGAKTKVLMLSATPVNTSLIDLRNQIYLMTEGRENDFRESLGVGNIRYLMRNAQHQFKKWEKGQACQGRRDKAKLLENLGADFLRLLDGVSISRSRRHIEHFYADEMERVGQFPKHEKPDNHYPHTDLLGKLSYTELANHIAEFKLSVYRPSLYVTDPERLQRLKETRAQQNFNQLDSERFLVGMMRTNFLKRLESSADSLRLTLERTIRKIDDLLKKIDRYEKNDQAATDLSDMDTLPEEDEEDEDDELFVNRGRQPYRLQELDLVHWRKDLVQDRKTLAQVHQQVANISPERDGKLYEIKQAIRYKANNSTINLYGGLNRKILVFTTFKDTARYLYENLKDLTSELGINMAMVSGDETHTTAGANRFNDILTNFAPNARNRDESNADLDLIIATDCISEGQNLQDCDTVLNYDIHWNPVRIIQRFGRIDRIGSRNRAVHMVNYWPTSDMDVYLKLEHRVQARMALADLAATGDGDPFTEEDAQMELSFRDKQLLKLRNEALTMDDLDDGPSLSDFTMEHFLAQLMHYLERNRNALKAMPRGVYAVSESNNNVQPGIIFCLHQQNASEVSSRQRVASQVHPFYLVYIYTGGNIRFGCGNARQILSVFEEVAVGKTSALTTLCDQFDRETEQGRKMTQYDKALTDVIAHICQAHTDTQHSELRPGGARDFVFSVTSETPNSASDFKLVTWLVIK